MILCACFSRSCCMGLSLAKQLSNYPREQGAKFQYRQIKIGGKGNRGVHSSWYTCFAVCTILSFFLVIVFSSCKPTPAWQYLLAHVQMWRHLFVTTWEFSYMSTSCFDIYMRKPGAGKMALFVWIICFHERVRLCPRSLSRKCCKSNQTFLEIYYV